MSADSSVPQRLHGLDALRGIALLLGIVLHASMAYFPIPMWLAVDRVTSPAASALFFAIHLFRMTTFFLIAGFFAHLLLDRRGTGGFIRDRLKRIAGPLVVFWPIMLAAIIATMVWAAMVMNGGTLPKDTPPPPPLTIATFPLMHLWFLWVLLIFYAALLIGRAMLDQIDPDRRARSMIDRAVRGIARPWAALLLALPLAVALYLRPSWVMWLGIPTPDIGLVPNMPAIVGFGTAFLFGYLLHRQPALLARIGAMWPVNLALAITGGSAALMLAGGPTPVLVPVPETAAKIGLALLYAGAAFAASLAATGLALRFLDAERPTMRYIADSSYWIYILHLPIVVAGQVLLLPVAMPWWAKLVIVIAGSTVLLLASYHLLVRSTFIGGWLNGRRYPWRRSAGLPAAATVSTQP